jgi:Fe-S-cluster containining protein
MKEIQRLKEEILKDYPRLDLDSEFTFACHSGVPCFNACCADVNIFLTPYDIIRLKNRLGITSQEFLDKYTILPMDKNINYPVVLFRLNDDEKKTCQLVSEKGCTVYEDRPWACRMYPLGLASPKEGHENVSGDFYFLLREGICKGFNENRKLTVAEWIEDQGIKEYNEMGEYFKEITMHSFFEDPNNLTPEKVEMFFMICYNIDKFRAFLFGSSFFDKFEVPDEVKAVIKDDDIELLKFGYQWLRFSLFGEKTMTIKTEVAEDKTRELKMKGKLT